MADGRGGTAVVTFVLDSTGSCSAGGLPDTGSPIRGWWLPLAVGLILLGAALLLLARRRP